MTSLTKVEREWTQKLSGDWYTDGANGRKYRYHPLSGLHCFNPLVGFEYGVGVTPAFSSDPSAIDAAVERHEAEHGEGNGR